MVEAAASALTTFPPGDCGAALTETDIVHEYVFAEFQPVARKVGELQTSLTLDFPGTRLWPPWEASDPPARRSSRC
jgi:hypothetical protein